MAKKKAGGKKKAAAPKRSKGKVTASKSSSREAKPRKQRQSVRSQALPGMERVRNTRLDNLCEAIGDERESVNKAKQEEQSLIGAALNEMQRSGITVYRHSKIELARVPGAEKLRVRLTKEEGDASESDLEQGDTGDLEHQTDQELQQAAGE